MAHEGDFLDTPIACPPLTSEEERQYNGLVEGAKREKQPEVETAKEQTAETVSALRGIDLKKARAVVAASTRRELSSWDTIEFDDDAIGVVSVADGGHADRDPGLMLLFTSLFAHGGFAQPGGEPGGEGSIALVNGGFETGDFTGWTLASGSGWQVASAGTTGNSDPRTGSFYARVSGNTAGVARRQTFDLAASGFTTVEIDPGTLTLNFTGWIGGEDGVNDGGRIRVNYLDGSMTLIDSTETSTTIAAAGVYVQHTISEPIPSGTRFLQLDMVLRGNAGGSTLPFGDDFEASPGRRDCAGLAAMAATMLAWWNPGLPRLVPSPEQMSDTLPIDPNSAALGIGRHVSGIADPFNGHIDEFRISHVHRSGGWIEATWNNMSDPTAFIVAGAEEQEGGGGKPPPLAGAGVVVCPMA